MTSSSFFVPSTFTNVTTLGQNLRVREEMALLQSRLAIAQQQLASGKVASTHGDLDGQSLLLQGLRQQRGRNDAYMDTITMAESRIAVMQGSLQGIQDYAQSLSVQAQSAWAPGFPQDLQSSKTESSAGLEQILTNLNAKAGGRYLFGGSDVSRSPVINGPALLDGASGRMGLRDTIPLRLAADMGTGNMGRLAVDNGGTTTVTVSHDGGPFGMRLTGVTSYTANATTTAVAEGATVGTSSGSLTFVNTAAPGDRMAFTFRMPDGKEQVITLEASATARAADTATDTYYFTPGGSALASATNVDAALESAIQDVVARKMTGHSAIAAANDFFDHGKPLLPATAGGVTLTAATAATANRYISAGDRVVDWYQGEDAPVQVAGVRVGVGAPAGPAVGDTYLVQGGVAPGTSWDGFTGVAKWNGQAWEMTRAEAGMRFVDNAGHTREFNAGTSTWTDLGQAASSLSDRDTMKARVTEGQYISYGARATEESTRQALKGAAILQAAEYNPASPDSFIQVNREVAGLLKDAETRVIRQRSEIGVDQEQLDLLRDQMTDQNLILDKQILNIEGVDDYQLSLELNQMMTQLESSYAVTARLSRLTLTNYI